VERFHKKHRPADRVSAIEVNQKLDALRMKRDDDPKDLFEKI